MTGPPVSAAFEPDGEPTPAAAGFAKKHGVEVVALERQSRRRRATYLAYRVHQRGKAAVDVLPDVLARPAARPDVSRSRCAGTRSSTTARASCRSAGRSAGCCSSTAAASCRSSSGAPSWRRARGAGHPLRRGHLRPSLPDDQRPRRPRDQGQDVRRLPGAAARELRHPRSRASASDASAASSRRRAPARRARQRLARRRSRRCSQEVPDLVEYPVGRRRALPRRVPAAARGSADDDDDPPPALLPGGGRRGQAEAGVSRRASTWSRRSRR